MSQHLLVQETVLTSRRRPRLQRQRQRHPRSVVRQNRKRNLLAYLLGGRVLFPPAESSVGWHARSAQVGGPGNTRLGRKDAEAGKILRNSVLDKV
jgi:hypothetical protein